MRLNSEVNKLICGRGGGGFSEHPTWVPDMLLDRPPITEEMVDFCREALPNKSANLWETTPPSQRLYILVVRTVSAETLSAQHTTISLRTNYLGICLSRSTQAHWITCKDSGTVRFGIYSLGLLLWIIIFKSSKSIWHWKKLLDATLPIKSK